MARARNIKPGFFKDEDLIEVSFAARLLFAGLWTLADRRGVLEDRPKRIKMEVFPADDVDMDALLDELASVGSIQRYSAVGTAAIWIPGFERHQNPHMQEKPSAVPLPDDVDTVPAPDKHQTSTVQEPDEFGSAPADSLNLKPEGTTAHSGRAPYPEEFEQAWGEYPKRHGDNPKNRAFKAWNARLREGHTATEMTEGVRRYAQWCEATGKVGEETVKQAATFFGRDKGFAEPWETKPQRKRGVVV